MRLLEGARGVHDDVDLRNQPRAGVVHADGVDALDERRVDQAHVGDELLGLDGGRDADEQEELVECGAQPDGRDQAGEDDSAHGVDPPLELGTAHRGEDTEAVDQQVVAVVLPEDVDLGVLVLQRPAIAEEAELGGEGPRPRQ